MPAYEDVDEIMNTPPKLPEKSAIFVQPSKIDYNDQEITNSELRPKPNSNLVEFSEELEQPYDNIADVLDELESTIVKNHLVNCSQPDQDNSTLKNQQKNENGFEPENSYIDMNSFNCEVIRTNNQELGMKDIENDYAITSSPVPEKLVDFSKPENESSINDESRNKKNGGEPNRSQITKAWNNLKKNAQNKYSKSHPTKEKTISKEISLEPTNVMDDKALPSHHTSNIVQIIRSKFVPKEYPGCSLGTFSRNSKLETFQASPSNCIEANNL